MSNPFHAETPEGNYEQRCLCVLCLDTSGSMGFGQPVPIEDLNKALIEFADEVKSDSIAKNRLEISIVTFDSTVNVIQKPALVDSFEMPKLTVTGTTKLVDGVREAIKMAKSRKDWYRENGIPYFRPFIVLMTDGAPDNDQDIDGLAREIESGEKDKHFTFWAVGARQYNHNMLQKICFINPPKTIAEDTENHVKYRAFFKWLSNSLKMVSKSKPEEQIPFQPTNSWEGGNFSQSTI